MKNQHINDRPVWNVDRIANFGGGVGCGLLVAYVISSFNHQLPDAVVYMAMGILVAAGWLPVIARRRRIRRDAAEQDHQI